MLTKEVFDKMTREELIECVERCYEYIVELRERGWNDNRIFEAQNDVIKAMKCRYDHTERVIRTGEDLFGFRDKMIERYTEDIAVKVCDTPSEN